MNYLIFDVIIALILLFALWRGYSRGFILTLCGFLAIFVAFIGATVISDNLARPVADAIRPAIERQIQGTLEQSLQVEDSLASTGGEAPALEDLPISEVLEALQESALYRGLAQAFQEAVDNGVAQVTTSAAKALAEYAAVQLARMVLFLLAFVGFEPFGLFATGRSIRLPLPCGRLLDRLPVFEVMPLLVVLDCGLLRIPCTVVAVAG